MKRLLVRGENDVNLQNADVDPQDTHILLDVCVLSAAGSLKLSGLNRTYWNLGK